MLSSPIKLSISNKSKHPLSYGVLFNILLGSWYSGIYGTNIVGEPVLSRLS